MNKDHMFYGVLFALTALAFAGLSVLLTFVTYQLYLFGSVAMPLILALTAGYLWHKRKNGGK